MDWKCDLSQERWAPRTKISGRNREAECVVERLIQVRPPENGNVSDIKGDVLKNDVVIFVNADRPRVQMKIRSGRIVRRKRRVFDAVNIVRRFVDGLSTQEIGMVIRPDITRANLFRVDVVNSALGDVDAGVAINADVPFH